MRIAVMMAVMTLAGCGGGNRSGSSGTAADPSVGGIWRGPVTTASGAVVEAWLIVSEDGRFFSSAYNPADDCADVSEGSLTSSNGTFSGSGNFGVIDLLKAPQMQSDCTLGDGSVWGTSAYSGSIVQRTSLTLTSRDTTSSGTALPTATAGFTYDALYNESSDLAKIAGTWAGQRGAVFSIDANGVLFSQDTNTGCTVNGEVSLINAAYNAYTATVSYANCAESMASLNGVTAVGLMSLNDTVVPEALFMGYTAVLQNGETLMLASTATR